MHHTSLYTADRPGTLPCLRVTLPPGLPQGIGDQVRVRFETARQCLVEE